MNEVILVLFAIPILCIIVIAWSQFHDEMFKKKFLIERRNRDANAKNQVTANRRYNDPKGPAAHSETVSQSSAAADASNLEASGLPG